MSRDIEGRIIENNEGRNPDLLRMKYKDMGSCIFKFYRGTAHIFYDDVYKKSFLLNSPKVWACGDLHFENFGSYKGDNGLVYFDINDFDEAALAPCLFDIARFLVSLVLIAAEEGFSENECLGFCEKFVDVYCETLATGNSRWIEKQTAEGVIKRLLEKVELRKPLYKTYTNKIDGTRQFDFSHKKLVPTTWEEKKHVIELIRNWHEEFQARNVYNITDIAFHIKGSGSLGIKRYLLLVQKKKDGRYTLVDLKMASPSCLNDYFKKVEQPMWDNEAKRTVEIQKRVQGTSQALLEAVITSESSFVLREYQSHEDKVSLRMCNGKIKSVNQVISTMAKVTAWGQLQSGGRQGSCITDDLIDLSNRKEEWKEKILSFSKEYVNQVKEDYQSYLDSGIVGAKGRKLNL